MTGTNLSRLLTILGKRLGRTDLDRDSITIANAWDRVEYQELTGRSEATPAEVRKGAVDRLGTRFDILAQTLAKQPYLTGDKFSIADAYLFVLLNWTKIHKVDLGRWPALTEFQSRVAARAAVQATFKAEGLTK